MTVKLTNVNPAIPAAVASAFAGLAKAGRKELPVGTHKVEANVQIKGELVVGEPYERRPTTSIPFIKVFAAFAARAGCTKEATLAYLTEVLTHVLTNDEKDATAAFSKRCKDIEAAIEDVKSKVLDQLPKVRTNGKTGFVVEELNVTSSCVETVAA